MTAELAARAPTYAPVGDAGGALTAPCGHDGLSSGPGRGGQRWAPLPPGAVRGRPCRTVIRTRGHHALMAPSSGIQLGWRRRLRQPPRTTSIGVDALLGRQVEAPDLGVERQLAVQRRADVLRLAGNRAARRRTAGMRAAPPWPGARPRSPRPGPAARPRPRRPGTPPAGCRSASTWLIGDRSSYTARPPARARRARRGSGTRTCGSRGERAEVGDAVVARTGGEDARPHAQRRERRVPTGRPAADRHPSRVHPAASARYRAQATTSSRSRTPQRPCSASR